MLELVAYLIGHGTPARVWILLLVMAGHYGYSNEHAMLLTEGLYLEAMCNDIRDLANSCNNQFVRIRQQVRTLRALLSF